MFRVLLLSISAAAFAAEPGDLRQLVRDSLRFMQGDRNVDLDYSWRSDRKQFDSSGKITSQTTLIGEKTSVDGITVFRLIERDGKKLTEEQVQEQEAKIRQTVAKTKAERQRGKNTNPNAWIAEVSDAMDFKFTGEQTINGRLAWMVTCAPRPGYSAKNTRARVFEKMNGKMWIDQADRELVRAEAETFDTVSVGFGLLGRVEKGTRVQLARTRLPEGAWVLESQIIRFGARVLLVKWLGNEIHTKQWNYRRRKI